MQKEMCNRRQGKLVKLLHGAPIQITKAAVGCAGAISGHHGVVGQPLASLFGLDKPTSLRSSDSVRQVSEGMSRGILSEKSTLADAVSGTGAPKR